MRPLTFFFLFILLTLVPVPAAVVLIALYAMRWPGLELVVAGAAIDAFYGAGHVFPVYTFIAGGLLLLITWLRPRFAVYNE